MLVAYGNEELTSVEQLGKLVALQANAKTIAVECVARGPKELADRELAPGKLGVVFAKEPAREAIAARRQADQMLAKFSRGDSYAELPGTQVEIARLAELFDAKAVTTLTRADASEERLDELRKAGALKQFRYLHLATHGKANNIRAFRVRPDPDSAGQAAGAARRRTLSRWPADGRRGARILEARRRAGDAVGLRERPGTRGRRRRLARLRPGVPAGRQPLGVPDACGRWTTLPRHYSWTASTATCSASAKTVPNRWPRRRPFARPSIGSEISRQAKRLDAPGHAHPRRGARRAAGT